MAVYKEADSQKDERDTEPLSHIKHHILFETHLRFLDELNDESHAEAAKEECSYKEATMKLFKPVPVHEYLEDAQNEIAQCLI